MRTIVEIHYPKCRLLSLFLMFSLILITNVSFAQKIEPGRYVYEYGDDVKSIFEVLNDSTIYLTETFGTDHLFGYGNYYIEENKLILSFKKIPADKLVSMTIPEFKIHKENITKEDNININLNVIENWDNSQLEGVRINIADSNYNIINDNLKTNDSGYANLKVSKIFLPIIVKVFFVGYEPLEIKITENKDYDVTVILKSYINKFYKENELREFELQILNPTSFKLENYYANFDWSTFYRE